MIMRKLTRGIAHRTRGSQPLLLITALSTNAMLRRMPNVMYAVRCLGITWQPQQKLTFMRDLL